MWDLCVPLIVNGRITLNLILGLAPETIRGLTPSVPLREELEGCMKEGMSSLGVQMLIAQEVLQD